MKTLDEISKHQLAITIGKLYSGTHPGDPGWSHYDHQSVLASLSDDTKKILPCPFCGKSESIVVITASIEWNQTHDDPYPHDEAYAFCCDASTENLLGGCGARSGYAPTEELALELWNIRAPSGVEG